MSELTARLTKTVDDLTTKLKSVRTGRARPDLLTSVFVDYYGTNVPIKQLASITVADGSVLMLNVFDRGAVSAIEKAIMMSSLGLNPQTDGSIIRLQIPPLTEDRRMELVKYTKKLSEDAKVALRNIRRQEMDLIKKDDTVSDDDKKRESDRIDGHVNRYMQTIDDLIKDKQADILTI